MLALTALCFNTLCPPVDPKWRQFRLRFVLCVVNAIVFQRCCSRLVRMDQPHSKEVSEMEAAHISPELPIRWFVSADRTVEIKEEVTELGCDQANERILQEETPPSSITERDRTVEIKEEVTELGCDQANERILQEETPPSSITERVRTDQPHSKEVSEMEAAHISPELPIRWVVSADRTVEIKEEVTELGCDQANERILQEETPPSSITERGYNWNLSYNLGF
ncbi:UNVERIFIED_CONTAM: hypothetical protein FKN15_074248 [Acipenser sinensis]